MYISFVAVSEIIHFNSEYYLFLHNFSRIKTIDQLDSKIANSEQRNNKH